MTEMREGKGGVSAGVTEERAGTATTGAQLAGDPAKPVVGATETKAKDGDAADDSMRLQSKKGRRKRRRRRQSFCHYREGGRSLHLSCVGKSWLARGHDSHATVIGGDQ